MFTPIRAYFRTNMDALGFTEWKDGFNVDNIPATRLEKSYHLSAVTGSRRDAYDMTSQDIDAEIVIRIARKGFRDPASAIDQCAVDLDAILLRVLAPSRRLGAAIKNVFYRSHVIDPVADSNDNVAVLEITFGCLIILNVEG